MRQEKERRQTAKFKAQQKAYRQRPDVKEKNMIYGEQYRQQKKEKRLHEAMSQQTT